MPYFLPKFGKLLQKLSSAAVVIGALSVNIFWWSKSLCPLLKVLVLPVHPSTCPGPEPLIDLWINKWGWAATHDFQQCGSLTSVGSDEPVQPPYTLRNSKWCSVSSFNTSRIFKQLDCAIAQVGLILWWSHIPHCWKYAAVQVVCEAYTVSKQLWCGWGFVSSSVITCTWLVTFCLNFDDLLHSYTHVLGFVSEVTL